MMGYTMIRVLNKNKYFANFSSMEGNGKIVTEFCNEISYSKCQSNEKEQWNWK